MRNHQHAAGEMAAKRISNLEKSGAPKGAPNIKF